MTETPTDNPTPGGRIEPIELQTSMQRSYIDYAMAVIVDAITGVLTGSAFASSCFGAERQDVGHLMMAIDIARFMPVGAFRVRMDAFIREIRSSPLAPGAEAIYLPGELEYRREQERRREGVPIENERLDGLRRLGAELGVPTALPEPA